jgi:outer membrane biogenesis lipoprotein LolB
MTKRNTILIACLFLAGCASPSKEPGLTAPVPATAGSSHRSAKTRIDERDAILIARDAVTKNDTWADRATYTAQRNGKGWTVLVRRIEGYDSSGEPYFVSAGHRLVRIDAKGNVTAYVRGE